MDEKDIQKLKEIGEKMNTQDNRSTAFPLFIIQSLKKVYRDSSWGYDKRERKESYEEDLLCKSCADKLEDGEELPEECDDCDQEECFHFYNEEYQDDLQAGVFFTEEACNNHIKQNGYHYHKPRSYVISAWRNYEIQDLLKMLSILASKDGKVNQSYL